MIAGSAFFERARSGRANGAALVPCLLLLFLFGCAGTQGEPAQPSATIKSQPASPGTNGKKMLAFKHIPYAKPPIGPLRWAPPQPLRTWSGAFEAKQSPPACMQQITPSSRSRYGNLRQSEDCLYLNVFAPANALSAENKKPLPVLFLIHGGGRARSSADRINADIAALTRQNIVVVTPQYRLGIFSFFAHPELSAESPQGVSGNYGLLDLVEALKWVQANITRFGGDPSSVTVMGPSGGGTATGVLLATPLSKGLFHRAAPLCSNAGIARMHRLKQRYLDQPSAEELGLRFARRLDAPSLAALRALPARAIQDHVLKSGVHSYDPPTGAGDVVDGWVFRQPVLDQHIHGKRHDVPVMLGFNADEVSLFNSAGLIDEIPGNTGEYNRFALAKYGSLSNDFLKHYPSENLTGALYDAARDRVVSYGSETVARFSHMARAPAYLYYMAHRPADANRPVNGASRNRDVSHCAGYKFFTGWYPKQGAKNSDHALARTMFGYAINFIKTGNPNQAGLPEWRPYERSAQNYMHFEDGQAQAASNMLPGMWELHEKLRLQENNQGKFGAWLGGWSSESLLRKNRIPSQ